MQDESCLRKVKGLHALLCPLAKALPVFLCILTDAPYNKLRPSDLVFSLTCVQSACLV